MAPCIAGEKRVPALLIFDSKIPFQNKLEMVESQAFAPFFAPFRVSGKASCISGIT